MTADLRRLFGQQLAQQRAEVTGQLFGHIVEPHWPLLLAAVSFFHKL
jgi:hypothetical protein